VVDLEERMIFLIDYGLVKMFRHPKTLVHKPYRTDKNLTGTARYASLNTHKGIEQSRRDDLERLGFLMIYFFFFFLPWQGVKANTKREKYERIKQIKDKTTIFELCESLPNEIYQYMVYVRGLGYEEAPDYEHLENVLENGIRADGLQDDGMFDWLIKKK